MSYVMSGLYTLDMGKVLVVDYLFFSINSIIVLEPIIGLSIESM